MTRRSKSSERWLREHFTDPYVKRARAAGWRSRAVFKLEEIDQRERLLKPGMVVLDLGAAPGAWSQYARRRVGRSGRVMASDILPMEPIAGVEFFRGISASSPWLTPSRPPSGPLAWMCCCRIWRRTCPAWTRSTPRAPCIWPSWRWIGRAALETRGYRPDQVLQGAGFQELVAAARRQFAQVRFLKPEASRSRSPETYLLASGRRMV